MSGEGAPGPADEEDEPAEPATPDDEALLRQHEQLLARVREANRQSRTGPDSPTLHLYLHRG